MLLIQSNTTNPYFNIATEEFLLKNSNEDILFLYKNSPSVVIGKHQIYNIEVNIPYVINHKIPVIRRISGGGSVYHDENNLNYSIITSAEKAWVDFEGFTRPFILYLESLGLSPELRSKSDIRLAGKKISGNASHILKNRVMHHGSILFATNLQELTNCLKNKPSNYISRTVASRRSIVTNINHHLKTKITIDTFTQNFANHLKNSGLIDFSRELDDKENSSIEKLIEEKYRTAAWNVGYNANYAFKNVFYQEGEIATISMEVKKGICITATLTSPLYSDLQEVIINVPHETSVFTDLLSSKIGREKILKYFF